MKPSPSSTPEITPEIPFSTEPLPLAEPPRAGDPADSPVLGNTGLSGPALGNAGLGRDRPSPAETSAAEAVPAVESSQAGDPVLTGPLVRDPFAEPLSNPSDPR